LRVAYVLEGSVRKSGDRVRVTAQLIHVADGYHVWAETYDRTLDDIFVIQDEIAAKVVAQLKVTLLGKKPNVEETDARAYALALQARYLDRLGNSERWKQAVALYEQALAIDSSYAAAWTGLAQTYIGQAGKSQRPFQEGYELAREAAGKALAIDPDHAEANALLGKVADAYDGDLTAAARHFERAMTLAPADPEIRIAVAVFAMSLGRLGEAIALLRRTIASDPVNAFAHRSLAIAYYGAGQYDSAIAALRTALTISPDGMGLHGLTGRAFLMKGEPELALAAIRQEQSDWTLLELPLVYQALGQFDRSNDVLAQLIAKYPRDAASNIAYIRAYRGEPDEAFIWLDRAVENRDPGLTDIICEPLFSNVHDDPRWQSFLERIGRSPRQLASIKLRFEVPD
ncbi:MAG: tetratricopeptide repeat protein, partial [Steroidobacteraceae bacterium]|nr:tetratricopeptide repeat protein [Steroidobacteraceae bacterium]